MFREMSVWEGQTFFFKFPNAMAIQIWLILTLIVWYVTNYKALNWSYKFSNFSAYYHHMYHIFWQFTELLARTI